MDPGTEENKCCLFTNVDIKSGENITLPLTSVHNFPKEHTCNYCTGKFKSGNH